MTYPDRDCPPHFYARGNNPQFHAFAKLMQYMQRAAHLLTDGQPLIDAAILYHAESEWSTKKYQLFQKPMRELMEHQLDCDVIPAQILNEAYVEDKKLHIGMMTYSCLVLPGAMCEDKQAAEFVIKAAKKGLPVYAVDYTAVYDTYGNLLSDEFKKSVIETKLKDLACLLYTSGLHRPCLRRLHEKQCYQYGRSDQAKAIHLHRQFAQIHRQEAPLGYFHFAHLQC